MTPTRRKLTRPPALTTELWLVTTLGFVVIAVVRQNRISALLAIAAAVVFAGFYVGDR